MAKRNTKLAPSLLVAAFVAMTIFVAEAERQMGEDSQPKTTTSPETLRPGVAEDQLFAELSARNELRKAALSDYSVLRTYQVVDLKGKVHAEEIGHMEFHAPDQKKFVVTSESGSG